MDHNALARAIIAQSSRPERCSECGGYMEDEERGDTCGLCFPITSSMRDYLAAWDAWAYARRTRPAWEVREAESMRADALSALVYGTTVSHGESPIAA